MSNWLNPFVGSWKYRSFRNKPEPIQKLEDILFWEATLTINANTVETISGEISDETDRLIIKGATSYGAPFSIRFQAVGEAGTETEGWIYDYIGYLVPVWPSGVEQKPAIVGSVIRTVPHSDGKAKAGYIASFIAVRTA